MSVPQEALDKIKQSLGAFCSYLHISVAKLFVSPNSENEDLWRDPNIVGYLTLFVSRKLKTTAIRIYDMNTFNVLFETELYYNFRPISSEEERRIVILPHQVASFCFVFTDVDQGTDFFGKLQDASNKYKNETLLAEEKKRKKKGFFSFFKKDKKKNKQKTVTSVITGPSQFKHIKHMDGNQMTLPEMAQFDNDNADMQAETDATIFPKKTMNSERSHKKSLSHLKTDMDWDNYISSIDFSKSPVASPLHKSQVYDQNLTFTFRNKGPKN